MAAVIVGKAESAPYLVQTRIARYRHTETINPPATISAPPTMTAGVGIARKKM
jgi:hypothetical protein